MGSKTFKHLLPPIMLLPCKSPFLLHVTFRVAFGPGNLVSGFSELLDVKFQSEYNGNDFAFFPHLLSVVRKVASAPILVKLLIRPFFSNVSNPLLFLVLQLFMIF